MSTEVPGRADIVWFDVEPRSSDIRVLSKEDLAERTCDQRRILISD
jgi:hypothetical protein